MCDPFTRTPPSELKRLHTSRPRYRIVTYPRTDNKMSAEAHLIGNHAMCKALETDWVTRHSIYHTCMLHRVQRVEQPHHGEHEVLPMGASPGRSAPLFYGQKRVKVASHALKCRRSSLRRSLPVHRPNKRPSECPRWHDNTENTSKSPVSTLLALLAAHS